MKESTSTNSFKWCICDKTSEIFTKGIPMCLTQNPPMPLTWNCIFISQDYRTSTMICRTQRTHQYHRKKNVYCIRAQFTVFVTQDFRSSAMICEKRRIHKYHGKKNCLLYQGTIHNLFHKTTMEHFSKPCVHHGNLEISMKECKITIAENPPTLITLKTLISKTKKYDFVSVSWENL